jgi:hypothetical protein
MIAPVAFGVPMAIAVLAGRAIARHLVHSLRPGWIDGSTR